jgi:hypothetical protein
MLRTRLGQPVFHPNRAQRVLEFGEAIFAVRQVSPKRKEQVAQDHHLNTSHRKAPFGRLSLRESKACLSHNP